MNPGYGRLCGHIQAPIIRNAFPNEVAFLVDKFSHSNYFQHWRPLGGGGPDDYMEFELVTYQSGPNIEIHLQAGIGVYRQGHRAWTYTVPIAEVSPDALIAFLEEHRV
jgi:hypothetical protein